MSRNSEEIVEGFKTFLSTYFEGDYDEKLLDDCPGIFVDDGHVGGWSSLYCHKTWNDLTLENDADLEIFDLLLNIDIKNGADTSKIVHRLCLVGAFEAVKVRVRLFIV